MVNQNKIADHFIATTTGGEIMIVALNSSYSDTTKQIRNHIADIQNEFSKGNFTKPFFIHAQQVPGTKLMTEKKDIIKYSIRQMNNGSALLLTTNDQQLIEAIHQFIAFQTGQHRGHWTSAVTSGRSFLAIVNRNDANVNVHTVKNPNGEIRGQIFGGG